MPLALLAVLNTAPSPSLVLIDEDSILNRHVSGMAAPRLGYMVRTYSQWLAELRSGRANTHPTPSTLIAVHQDLDSLKYHMTSNDFGRILQLAWNHIENIRHEELLEMIANPSLKVSSATVRIPGFPGAVGVLIARDKRDLLVQAAVALGLDYQNAVGGAGNLDRTSEIDPTRV